jgi:FlaA1/EpsC-like NDP-sugar epimerase
MKKMVLYGAGGFGYWAYNKLKDRYDIVAFVDSEPDKQNQNVNGLHVYPPNSLGQLEYDIIEICSGTSAYIIKQFLIHD